MPSNHCRVAWIISDHQIKPAIQERLVSSRVASAEITRQGFGLKPSELQIGTSVLSGGEWEMGWGTCMLRTVSVQMTSALAILGNLPSAILLHVFHPRLSEGSNGGSAPCMFLSEQYAVLLHSSRRASPRKRKLSDADSQLRKAT